MLGLASHNGNMFVFQRQKIIWILLSTTLVIGLWVADRYDLLYNLRRFEPVSVFQLHLTDQIEIYALDGGREKHSIGQANTFPIWPYALDSHDSMSSGAKVLGMRKLQGSDAEKIKALWSALVFDDRKGLYCHEPAYGLRFFANSTLLLETSLCWNCENYYTPDGKGEFSWHGFDSNTESANALL